MRTKQKNLQSTIYIFLKVENLRVGKNNWKEDIALENNLFNIVIANFENQLTF